MRLYRIYPFADASTSFRYAYMVSIWWLYGIHKLNLIILR